MSSTAQRSTTIETQKKALADEKIKPFAVSEGVNTAYKQAGKQDGFLYYLNP